MFRRSARAWTRALAPLVVLALTPRLTLGDSPVAPASVSSATRPATPEIVESRGTFTSQGKTIRVDRYEPKAPGRHPGVVVLYGSGGMLLGGPAFRETARQLAREGYVAHLIHYFDLTGTVLADKATMVDKFPVWMQGIADGLGYLEAQPNVDPNRLGVVGFSLGGFLSLSVAVFDPRVAAVVDYFGGLPAPLARDLKELPPILILHGEKDRIVPPAEARAIESVCKAKNVPHEVQFYADQGHGFVGDAARDALTRTVSFLNRHVKQTPKKHEVARPKLDDATIAAMKAEAAAATQADPANRP